jgi:rfaE bifunctional protein kinase chain/domain
MTRQFPAQAPAPLSRKQTAALRQALLHSPVLVVGDAMLDRYWYGSVERISPEAPVPILKLEREEERFGGAANVAYNVVTLGAPATLLSVVGDDAAGRSLSQLLQSRGVQAHLKTDPQVQTTVKLRAIGRQQQLLRIDMESAPNHEVLSALDAGFDLELPRHKLLLLSDYGKGGLTHVKRMIAAAAQAQVKVLIDPKGSDYARYSGATAMTPNRAELRQVVGPWRDETHLMTLAQNLRTSLGLQAIVLTRSEEGMTVFDAEGRLDVLAEAREVFDVTGAGDTVIAALAALVASGMSLREALPHANRAGGVVVGKFGTAACRFDELFTIHA